MQGSRSAFASLTPAKRLKVYRARDSQLGRDVAIKVLPAAFA